MHPTSLYCPKLIGRDAELAVLLRLAADAVAGRATVALVSGEAGIGKTRLLDELRSWAARRALVTSVTCPAYAPAPLGTIYAALDDVESRADVPAGNEPGAAGQLQVFGRVCQRLRAIATGRPVVAMVDDAHWADTATLEFLSFAARDLADSRVMLVLAYRPESGDDYPNFGRAIARVSRLPNVHHVALRGLSDVAVAEMLEAALGESAPLDRRTLRNVRDRAEGNPLFAEELLKATLENGDGAPATLRNMVSERAGQMTAGERRLLELSALLGRRFNLAFLETLASGVTRTEVLTFLRSAVRHHFLIEDRDDVGWFAFRHALVRDAVLERILAVERRELHLAIARALQAGPDAGERSAELSEHFWMAGETVACAHFARAAGDRALERFAYREAAEEYERFFACGAEGDARLHARAGMAYRALGSEKALEHLALAAELAERSDEREVEILAVLDMAAYKSRTNDLAGAAALLERAAAIERRAPDPRLKTPVLAMQALLVSTTGDFVPVQAMLAELEPLVSSAEPRDAFRFLTARGSSHCFYRRDYAAALADTRAAVAVAEAAGDPRMLITGMQTLALHSGRFQAASQALESFEAAAVVMERYGNLFEASVTRAHHANARIQAGRLEDAFADLRVLLAEPHENPLWHVYRGIVAARLAVYLRDDSLVARAGAGATFERFAGQNVGSWSKLAGPLAEAYAARGELDAARAVIERLATDPDLGCDEANACRSIHSIAALGTAAHVEAATAQIAAWRAFDNPIVRAYVALFDAYAETRFGALPDARRSAAAAAAAFGELQMPLMEAEARVLTGDRTRSADLATACGARRLPSLAASEPANERRKKPLSRREEEVATLAAAGRGNAAIAAELFLSTRTVEAHLASAFAKLGVNSRAALGAALADSARPQL